MHNENLARQAGFTLLEVLVSFIILVGFIGIIYQMLATGTIRTDRSQNESEAITIAQSMLNDVVVEIGEQSGELDEYRWHREINAVTELDDGDYPTKLINIKVSVEWEEFIGKRELKLETQKLFSYIN